MTSEVDAFLARPEAEDDAEPGDRPARRDLAVLTEVSHELRGPLNAMSLLAQRLEENDERNLTADQVEYARVIRSTGRDLIRLVDDVLEFARIDAATLPLDFRDEPLPSIRDGLAGEFQVVALERGVQFVAGLAPGLPPLITTDRRRLYQVLRNLLNNAFKFTERGSVRLDIERATDGWRAGAAGLDDADVVVAFRVSDTGIGIDESVQPRIFEPFVQADGGSHATYGGIGLGLSICRTLSDLLGGDIVVTSTRHEGSVFTLFLPARLPRGDARAQVHGASGSWTG